MDPSKETNVPSVENSSPSLEESYVIPSSIQASVLDGSQSSSVEEINQEFINVDYEASQEGSLECAPERLDQELSGSDDSISEEWQQLNKPDYSKVIFVGLYSHSDCLSVGCKFQITDKVHEDPCDYIGLFKIGFESITECVCSKMLSGTKCEEDGKVISCDFLPDELPCIEAGFYQFVYITRDKEICGASMPFEIKVVPPGKSPVEYVLTEKGEDDFLYVQHTLEKKSQLLEELLAESQSKNRELTATLDAMTHEADAKFKENEVVVETLEKEKATLKDELDKKNQSIFDQTHKIIAVELIISEQHAAITKSNNKIKALQDELDKSNERLKTVTQQLVPDLKKQISSRDHLLNENLNMMKQKTQFIDKLQKEAKQAQSQNSSLLEELGRYRAIHSPGCEQMPLMMQLDDQKFMIKALEDSKRLALEEMSALMESLSREIARGNQVTLELNQQKRELSISKTKIKELTEALDKRTEELDDASVELSALKKLKENPVSDIQQAELDKVSVMSSECQQKLAESMESERLLRMDLDNSKCEVAECKKELEAALSEKEKLKMDYDILKCEVADWKEILETAVAVREKLSLELDTFEDELRSFQKEAYELIRLNKPDPTTIRVKAQFISQAVSECEEVQKSFQKCILRDSLPSAKGELTRRRCETLATSGRVADIKLLLERAVDYGKNQAVKPKKFRVKCFEELRAEDYGKNQAVESERRFDYLEKLRVKCFEKLRSLSRFNAPKDEDSMPKWPKYERNPDFITYESYSSYFAPGDKHSIGWKCPIYERNLDFIDDESEKDPKFKAKDPKNKSQKIQIVKIPPSHLERYSSYYAPGDKHSIMRAIYERNLDFIDDESEMDPKFKAKDPKNKSQKIQMVKIPASHQEQALDELESKQLNSVALEKDTQVSEQALDELESKQLNSVAVEKDTQVSEQALDELKSKQLNSVAVEKDTQVSENVSDLELKRSALEKDVCELKELCSQLESLVAQKDLQISELSDKLCDMPSKCMLLEEALQELRTHYGEQKACLEESQAAHAQLKNDCMKKDALIEYLQAEKGDLSSKQSQLQDTVKEHTARLTEAAELYKKQFKEIEKLKRKLKRMERVPPKSSASTSSPPITTSNPPISTSDPPVVVLNDESKTSSPVHEIFYPARSTSDSDTGEHVSGDSSQKEAKDKLSKTSKTSKKQHSEEKRSHSKLASTKSESLVPDIEAERKSGNDSDLKKKAADKLGAEVQRFLIKSPKEPTQQSDVAAAAAATNTASEEEMYPLPCPMCDQKITVSSSSIETLTTHLETQHRMSMCPICGHFFEESVPKKYLTYHIEEHFNNEKTGK